MQNQRTRNFSVVLLILVLALSALYLVFKKEPLVETPVPPTVQVPTVEVPEATSTPRKIIGVSVEGREIERYTFGTGEKTLLFVGGMHGGYEWNSSLLAYEVVGALETGTLVVPENLTVIIIPTLNPDGLYSVIKKVGRFTYEDVPEGISYEAGNGRLNANNVDLNRNFNCKWQPESTWRSKVVSAGSAAFSEPEAKALQELVAAENPAAAIFWHSQGNAVYASECEAGILPETKTLMSLYAEAASYTPILSFDAYPITGDAEGWLASLGIPAVTVELESRTSTEWARNSAALRALFLHYSTN